jgi:hypothetical protein
MAGNFMTRGLIAGAALTCLFVRGNMPPVPPPPSSSVFAADYGDAEMWLCRPDLPSDACRGDLDTTELEPDGSRTRVPFVPAPDPKVDCFYVYPTVDPSWVPGNHVDFHDTTIMREVTRFEVARFGSVCRLFVPLYRQVTIATYLASQEEREVRLGAAFDDVLDAFRYYREHFDEGHPIALIGHSQGAEMVVRLLRSTFEHDASLRRRLLAAIAVGTNVQVPAGRRSPDHLRHVPLCSTPDELGCLVAFTSFPADGPQIPWMGWPAPGHETACVNPAGLGGGAGVHRFTGAVFPTRSRLAGDLGAAPWAKTPFIAVRDYYGAACVDGGAGFRYLAVSAAPRPGDRRTSPFDLDGPRWRTPFGFHIVEFQFAQQDLIDLVARKAEVMTQQGLAP